MTPMSDQLIIIQQRIYHARGTKVMLDYDLAELYQVETRSLNQAVRRNRQRFPQDFMFQLNNEEWEHIKSLKTTAEVNRSQIVIGSQKHRTELPYAFAQPGVGMLASVLRSQRAIAMNVAIVRAFLLLQENAIYAYDLADQIREIRNNVSEHDEQLKEIYKAIELLLVDRLNQKKWEDRQRIGYKTELKEA